ncbi:MAG: YwqG family protein [Planctomycetota bacterium]
MEQDEIRLALIDAGLSRVADELTELAENCIGIQSIAAKDSDTPIGASKFGGRPDMPSGASWPTWNGQPLAFLCQINLAAVNPMDDDQLLPSDGLLLFFYVADQSTWGFDPKDRGSWSVQYFPDTELVRTEWPDELDEESYYPACSLDFGIGVTLPGWETDELDQLNLSDEEQDQYFEFTEFEHHLLGHPQEIQGAMQLECQLVSNGLYCGDASGYNDPRAEELKSGESDWRLLLQLDSDDHADWMWGDCGRLYFWITSEDLESQNFSNCWMILQCG